jgi:hypothetical protein
MELPPTDWSVNCTVSGEFWLYVKLATHGLAEVQIAKSATKFVLTGL